MLLSASKAKRIPHALLFTGPSGIGKLAMAVSYARYLLCSHPLDDDACGTCPSCKRLSAFSHPDLHFSFPIVKKGNADTCEDYLKEWYDMLKSTLYFSTDDWLEKMGADNQQLLIPEKEADRIIDIMSLTSYEGKYKIMIIWLPELMNADASNNLLKLLEEPTPDSIFILVSNDATRLLPTIVSRTQSLYFRPLSISDTSEVLMNRMSLEPDVAMRIARIAGGSYLKALKQLTAGGTDTLFFEYFTRFMRLAFSRDLPSIKIWSDEVASWGREKTKAFIDYSLNMIRESFVYNFHRKELNFLDEQESSFVEKFCKFVNERNVIQLSESYSRAFKDISQNANARTVLFTLALETIILIRK